MESNGPNNSDDPISKGTPTDLDLRSIDELVGQVLESRYRIDIEVGRGGMGVVYRGTDLTLSRPVAIKTILHRQADETTLRRFIQEAKTLAQIEHPRLVPVYAVGQDEGYHYLVMKFLEGETLAQRIRKEGRQTPDFTRDVIRQVCEALTALHTQGLIHRDIKPANLMISPENSVTVMDLGIAKRIGEENNTTSSMAIGTPRYMPPEAVDDRPLDPRADLYSLGIIAFQMLVGEPPFNGPTPMSILYQQAHQPPPTVRSIVSSVPRNLESAIEIALQKDPMARFQDANQMAQAFSPDAQFVEPKAWRTHALQIAFVAGVLGMTLLFSDLLQWRRGETMSPVVNPPSQATEIANPQVNQGGDDAQRTTTTDASPSKDKVKTKRGQQTGTSRNPKPKSDTSRQTPPVKTQIRVKITSQPKGATIYEGSRRVGKTPYILTKQEGDVKQYTLKLQGFKPQKLVVRDQDVSAVLKSSFGISTF